jgi:hypothetical protein
MLTAAHCGHTLRLHIVFVQRAVEAIARLMVDGAQMQGISDAARAAADRSNSAEAGRKAFAEILRYFQRQLSEDNTRRN